MSRNIKFTQQFRTKLIDTRKKNFFSNELSIRFITEIAVMK